MRVIVSSLLGFILLTPSAWAVETPASAAATPPTTPVTATMPPAVVPPQPPATLAASRPTTTPIGAANAPKTPQVLTAEQLAKSKVQQEMSIKTLVKDQEIRLQQLEKANLTALTQNQELQLKNDNVGVQLQVLQSERSAQMFLYGAITLGIGVILGFLLAGYIYTKRRRQW